MVQTFTSKEVLIMKDRKPRKLKKKQSKKITFCSKLRSSDLKHFKKLIEKSCIEHNINRITSIRIPISSNIFWTPLRSTIKIGDLIESTNGIKIKVGKITDLFITGNEVDFNCGHVQSCVCTDFRIVSYSNIKNIQNKLDL